MHRLTIGFLLSTLASPCVAAGLDDHAIWAIAGTAATARWIVIHPEAEARATGLYHIEVIERARGAPAWRIARLAPHMAITAAALQRSVVKPLDRGAVYPEAFDAALARWRAENGGRGGRVCTTTVLACLGP